MQIQSSNTTFGSYKTLKNENVQVKNSSHLFLDEDEEKSQKPRLIVRSEGGYIRKYVVKPNGDEILVMEAKQNVAQKETQSAETGDLIDVAHDQLMKQLDEKMNTDLKHSLSVRDQKQALTKYKTGI